MTKNIVILFSENLAGKQKAEERYLFNLSITKEPLQRLTSANEGWLETDPSHPRFGETSIPLANETDWQIAFSRPIEGEDDEKLAALLPKLPIPTDIDRLRQLVIHDDVSRFGKQGHQARYMLNGLSNFRYFPLPNGEVADAGSMRTTFEQFQNRIPKTKVDAG